MITFSSEVRLRRTFPFFLLHSKKLLGHCTGLYFLKLNHYAFFVIFFFFIHMFHMKELNIEFMANETADFCFILGF